MIRLGGWCARRPRGAAFPAGRRWRSGGPAGRGAGRALRVLVDMDGVLADFEGGFLRKFRARFPDQPFIALEDRRGFWLSEQYGLLQPGLSEKAISIWESENFFLDLEPLPGAVEAVKQMANLENTHVFICTSPIKMYKYCPYEKGPSRTPAGSTSSSQPATTGTCSCRAPAAGCTRGRTTGRPFWTASGPAELDCTLGFPAGPLTSGCPARGLGGGGLPLRWPRPPACLPALPALPGLKLVSGQGWPGALDETHGWPGGAGLGLQTQDAEGPAVQLHPSGKSRCLHRVCDPLARCSRVRAASRSRWEHVGGVLTFWAVQPLPPCTPSEHSPSSTAPQAPCRVHSTPPCLGPARRCLVLLSLGPCSGPHTWQP
ncbi:5'(3')-deoxyribonucleotidase, mitochondrial isoform X1 [Canis lupus baileyi]